MEIIFYAADSVYGLLFLVAGVLAALEPKRDHLRITRNLVLIGSALVAARWSAWAITTDQPWEIRGIVGALMGAALFVLVPGVLHWLAERDRVPAPSPQVVGAQLQEIQEIDNFIGKKNEYDLRQTFDMLEYNRIFAIWEVAPQEVLPAQMQRVNEVLNGQMTWVKKYAHIGQGQGGAIYAEPILGKIPAIRRSTKYDEAVNRLEQYETSALTPQDLKVALHEFAATIKGNIELMADVFNELWEKNQNILIKNDDPQTPYAGAVEATFWSRFGQLRPRADKISDVMRKYLSVD